MGVIEVVECEPQSQHGADWKAFLEISNNGTLFHDLDFLAYHPADRFSTRHLIFRQDGEVVALLPAAVVTASDGKRFLKSPYGASVGGFVLPTGQSAETTLALVGFLKAYAAEMEVDGIDMGIGPLPYMRELNDHLGFGLIATGFRLVRSWLCHIVSLPEDPERFLEQCRPGKARDVRAGLRKGLRAREVGAAHVGLFYQLLVKTQQKHKSTPTHREEEISDLLERVPGRIRLFLCGLDNQELAGILLFVLNRRVAYTFYICQDEGQGNSYATAVLLAHVAKQVTAEGFRLLDLGPSTFDDLSLNCGLAFFKEGFGGRGFCRELWRWERG